MKIIIDAAVAALLIGTAGLTSASAATHHRPHHANEYKAFSATVLQPLPSGEYSGFAQDDGSEPHQTATGGPVGGIN